MITLKLGTSEKAAFNAFLQTGAPVSPLVATNILIVLCESGLAIKHWRDGYAELTEGTPRQKGVPWPEL